MKKKTKRIFLLVLILLILSIIGIITYNFINDSNKLTVEEKEWITQNINKVQNVNVVNNVDVYGKNGSGVFYDFINDFQTKYNLKVNMITYNYGEEAQTNSFKIVYDKTDTDIIFAKEHYIVLSKNKENLNDLSSLNGKKIAILNADEKIINKYFTNKNLALTTYDTTTNIFEALSNDEEKIDYAIIPLEENLTSILTSNYSINYHISDLNKYFIYNGENNTFNSILKKYFSSWYNKNFNNTYNKNELNTFITALSISDKEIDTMQARTYNYGLINNSPYEVLMSGSYGGITSEYLERFSSFSKTEYSYTRYKTLAKFTEALANRKIDIFYNYYNIDTDYTKINSANNINFVVVAHNENNIIINNISTLSYQTVYVLKNSLLEKYLTSVGSIKIKTYTDAKSLKKIIKKDSIIVLDQESYNYYYKNILSDYTIRYNDVLTDTYNFYTKNNDTFSLLLNRYIETLDPQEIKQRGIYKHEMTIKSGTILGQIAKYSIFILLAIIIILYVIYRSSKRIKIAKKIKKEDKMKYIDQLTSLKNRNYLNENIASWNKNTIYPQATIIVDLNEVQFINDTLGYEQGDAQIKAAANVLIKTQLDNTDIMRTDGNEYLIYLVGYQEKQVVSYIRKLYKELRNLPHAHGAAIGYSMITNDMKTIEDAINESVEDMRAKKEELQNEK